MWREFAEALCGRFGERSMANIVEEFNKLKQSRSVEMYQKCFEELRSYMIQHNTYLTEAFFVSSYLSGLNDELRPMVKVLRPQTVAQASEDARLQELVVEALLKKQRQQRKGMVAGTQNGVERYFSREVGKGTNGVKRIAG